MPGMASTAEERRKSPKLGSALVMVFGLLLLYVLSIGPAWQMHGHGRLSWQTISQVYRPVWWIIDQSVTVRWIVYRYLMLWYDDPIPPEFTR